MEYVVSLLWTFLELTGFCVFCFSFLEQRDKSRINKIFGYFLFWLGLFALAQLSLGTPFQQIGIWIVYLIACCLYFKGSVLHRILIITVYVVFAAAIDIIMVYGTSIIIGINFSDLIWRKLTYVAIVTTGKLLTVFLSYLTRYFRKEGKTQLTGRKWLFLTILFPAVSYFVLSIVFGSYANEDDISVGALVLCAVLAVADIASIYMIQQMERSTRKEKEALLLKQQMEIQTQSILDLEKSYRAQRMASHDFQRHLQAILDLIEMHKETEALDYVRKQQGVQSTRVLCVNSHHPIIDAVLNQKYQTAKEKGIEMQIQVNDLSQVSIATDALVVLLTNLLDNAIEACERQNDQRLIHCSINNADTFFISIRNTSLPVEITNGRITTSKPVALDHGIGLINICKILDDLSSEYTYGYDDGWFHFVAEIPCD